MNAQEERDRKIIIKIHEVHPAWILLACMFEDSDYHIDDMAPMRFDLVNFSDIDNREELLKRIGQAAYALAVRQDKEEHLRDAPIGKLNLKDLVGNEIIMTMADAYSGRNHNPHSRIQIRKKPWYRRVFKDTFIGK